MKSFIKKLPILFTFFLIAGIMTRPENVYAADYEVDILSENALANAMVTYEIDMMSRNALERIKNDSFVVADRSTFNMLKGQLHLEENTILFCTSDAPENVASLMASRSSDYEVVPYSFTKTYNTKNFWGDLEKFITIRVSGEVFIYSDGKVHLYSINVSTTPHKTGWNVSYESDGILNTDGSLSMCIYYVYCRKGSDEYMFSCWVTIYKDDTYPSITISQVY